MRTSCRTVSSVGKTFTGVVLLIGLGIVALPIELLASALSKARADAEKEKANCQESEQGINL